MVSANVLGFRSGGRYSRVVIPMSDELEMARRIFKLFVYGEGDNGPMGCSQIAKLLMEEQYQWTHDLIATRGKKRNEYTMGMIYDWQIKKVLMDCRYQGRQPHAGEEWNCPAFLLDGKPAVDVAMYERTQAKLISDKRVGNASNGVHALTGLIRCGECGQGLQVSAPTYTNKDGTVFRTPYWKNVKAESWCWCTHKMPSLRESTVDDYVDEMLAPLLLAEMRDKEAGQSEAELASRCAEIERTLREKDEEWFAEARQLRSDKVSPRTIAVYEHDHDNEVAKLQAKLSGFRTLLHEAHTLSISLHDLSKMTPTARRDAIHACLRWVAVIPSNKPREIDPKEPHRTRPSSHAGWVVFLSAFGTYHTAIIDRAFTGLTDHRQLTLRSARPDEAIGTVADFPDPILFLSGLERAYKGRKYKYNPAEITPGFTRVMASLKEIAMPIATFDNP